jgi:hypothetical protein
MKLRSEVFDTVANRRVEGGCHRRVRVRPSADSARRRCRRCLTPPGRNPTDGGGSRALGGSSRRRPSKVSDTSTGPEQPSRGPGRRDGLAPGCLQTVSGNEPSTDETRPRRPWDCSKVFDTSAGTRRRSSSAASSTSKVFDTFSGHLQRTPSARHLQRTPPPKSGSLACVRCAALSRRVGRAALANPPDERTRCSTRGVGPDTR